MWAIPILIPFLTAFGILVSPAWCVTKGDKYEKAENRKKFLIFMIVSVIVTGLVAGGLYWGSVASTYDREVWNNKIVTVKHEEEWTERESRTRQVACGTDSKGNTKYRTETYYVTEHYGPYWTAYTDAGKNFRISSGGYEKWKNLWANEKKVGEHRGSSAGLGRSITGGIFDSYWPKTFETIYPHATIHKYKNKVRRAPSVMNLGEPDKELEERYPRPASKENTSPVISYGAAAPADVMYLSRVNAKLGYRYEIHGLLIFMGKDERGLVSEILTAWQGPNKNELAVFVGHDNGAVKWCEVHSWLDNTAIHGEVMDVVMGMQQFDSKVYGDALMELVPKMWRRKEFEDFEYLKVETTGWWAISAVLISLVLEVVIAFVIECVVARQTGGYGYGRRHRW